MIQMSWSSVAGNQLSGTGVWDPVTSRIYCWHLWARYHSTPSGVSGGLFRQQKGHPHNVRHAVMMLRVICLYSTHRNVAFTMTVYAVHAYPKGAEFCTCVRCLIPAKTFALLCYASQISALVVFTTPALHHSTSSDWVCLQMRSALRHLACMSILLSVIVVGLFECSAMFSSVFTCS